ncbi:MAG: NAD-binding protein [Gammaproteobacteria bacterium]|jgi:S-adenosylhomocysteine hydrolase
MYNYEILYEAYSKKISEKDRQCTTQLSKQWEKSKPFHGKKVLLNGHITLSTLIIIDILIRGGAKKVDVTATENLVVHEYVLEIMKKAKITFYSEGRIPKNKINNFYDMAFDCGAGLLKEITPKKGMVELTQVDPKLYKNINFPVITVDNSETKKLETRYGTGDGLVRALIDMAKDSLKIYITQLVDRFSKDKISMYEILCFNNIITNYGKLFHDRKYMLFGYGKVGLGIALALSSAGVKKSDIYVIDVSKQACERASSCGYSVLYLSKNNSNSIKQIKKHLCNTYCVVTATGVENAISDFFDKKDFDKVAHLVNMGTPDEFGYKFKKKDVLNNKKLFNFILTYPTEVLYLDAIFTILLKAGKQLLEDKNLKNGIQNVSSNIDKNVSKFWNELHNNTEWKHTEYSKIVSKEIKTYLRRVIITPGKQKKIISSMISSRGFWKGHFAKIEKSISTKFEGQQIIY